MINHKFSSSLLCCHASGVCTEATPLFARGYTHLLGSTKNSWGWDLSKRGLYHGGKRSRYEYPNQTQRPLEQIPTVVVMIVDMDKGTVAFEVDSRYQGIAFTGLKGQTVYAAASAVWGNCQVEMKYLGSTYPGRFTSIGRDACGESSLMTSQVA